MTTGTSKQTTAPTSHEHINALRAAQALKDRRRKLRIRLTWVGVTVAVVGIVAAMMLTSRQETSSVAKVAPDFTLTDTSGTQVSLAALRGKNVLLYFSEGAGCEACLVQMSQIEKDPAFAAAGLTVLPIVMNTKDQITADMAANGVRTPFLLDDGTVSTEYGTIGKGMHAGLPGHSFVLIDKTGKQRWYGEYPSMWLSDADLLKEVQNHLTS
ncbi:MAG TPA: redoxin domain-containing protein [Dermatophilaceae bacterium]|jgi:peroxiredoxin